jgi:F-type H+/Na+-transporting ATPase subunit beta
VRGSVIDIVFPDGELPAINDALEIQWDRPWRLTAEVQSHLDPLSVRAVALQSSSSCSHWSGACARSRSPASCSN